MGWMIQHEVVSQLSITVLLFQHIPGFGCRWASYQFRSDAPEHTSSGFWEKLDGRPRLTPPTPETCGRPSASEETAAGPAGPAAVVHHWLVQTPAREGVARQNKAFWQHRAGGRQA